MEKRLSGFLAGPWWLWGWGLLGVLFGLMTLNAGGTVLFGGPEARAAAGDYVPFVLWFNFLAGFFYVVAGVGLVLGHRWATWMALALFVATLLVFATFGMYIVTGQPYEVRTVVAMTVRTLFWLIAFLVGLAGAR